MPRGGADPFTVHGLQTAANDANQAAFALSDLCLVPALREAVARVAQDRLIRSGSRRRVFSGCAFVHSQGTDEGGTSPKIAVSDSSRRSATKIAEVIRSRELSCESRRDLRSILHAVYFVTDCRMTSESDLRPP